VLPKDVCEEIAQSIYRAACDRTYVAPVTETHPGCDVASAYSIARAVNEAKLAAGLIVKGHKIGITSQPMRDLSGSDEPDYGTLFNDMFVPEDSTISRSLFHRGVGLEIEIAFVLGRPLRGPHVTLVDVIRATEFVLPAIEIVDSRYSHLGPGPLVVDSIADGAWCGGIVLGGSPRRLDQIDIRRIAGTLAINNKIEARGVSSAVMGNPVTAVAWLANKLSEFDVALVEGQVVMSGSFTGLVRIRPNSSVLASFDSLGDVAFYMSD
jgi:2-oxo-hept-3-ene-1,7-dioate hydratase/2-keto-4-pentenoate hydratase